MSESQPKVYASAGHPCLYSDWHASQALGSCYLEELTEAAPLCWLSWHSVNKGLNILDKQRTNMPFPTASRKKRVTGLQACSDSMMLSFFSLVRLGFSHAQWNKWFRWEECSWKEPCTHRYLYLLECKGASHCVAQCSQCPDVVPVECGLLMFSGSFLSWLRVLSI